MNSDYRVSITWRTDLKRKKLQKKLGPVGVLALMDIWSITAEQRSDGILRGWDQDDIELQVNWDGPPGELVAVLAELSLLDFDVNSQTYSIHNWMEWNHWATGAEKRSAKARAAAEARWNKQSQEDANSNAPRMPKACGEHSGGMQDLMQDDANSNAPSLTQPNPTLTNLTNPPPPAPKKPADENGGGLDQNQVQNQVVGGGDQDNSQGQGQGQNQNLGILGNDIEDLLHLLWKYQTTEGIKNPDTFFEWKRDRLIEEGLSGKDKQDLERLRKKEAQEIAEKEEKEREQRRLKEADRRKLEQDVQLYDAFESLPEPEKKRIEELARRKGLSPGRAAWRSGIAMIMRKFTLPATSGAVAGEI
jgi:hypothetical protein